MELAIIIVIVAVLAFFLWRSYASNKEQNPARGKDHRNPNPNAPTSSTKL